MTAWGLTGNVTLLDTTMPGEVEGSSVLVLGQVIGAVWLPEGSQVWRFTTRAGAPSATMPTRDAAILALLRREVFGIWLAERKAKEPDGFRLDG